MIEGHGDDSWKYTVPIKADFSSNVYYGSLDTGLRDHLRGAIDTVTHYPEAGAASLQKETAAFFDRPPGEVLVTNGVTEAIYLLAHTFRTQQATIVGPTFSEYADACTLEGMQIQIISWEHLVTTPPTGLVFICNPNNPTGKALDLHDYLRTIGQQTGALFIVDESYIEFTRAAESVLDLQQDNVIVLRSLTKSCRIPGLRVGFVIGRESILTQLRDHKMPWSVNQLALQAGSYIFQHKEDFTVPIQSLLAATKEWRHELAAATGWRVHDTDTHYFLMETPKEFTAAHLKLHLVSRYGLLIRDAANFKGLTPHHFRIACQSPEENRLFTEALRECSRTGI